MNRIDPHRASRYLGAHRLKVSFEFFPPKTEEMERTLWEAIGRLAPLAPSFVSVTYGAGGSTRERTHGTVKRLLAETALVPAAHLTCVDATCAEVDEVIQAYWDAGVRHVVALRGEHLRCRSRARPDHALEVGHQVVRRAEQLAHDPHVGDGRHVAEPVVAGRQQRSRHELEDRVLGSAHLNLADEAGAGPHQDAGHRTSMVATVRSRPSRQGQQPAGVPWPA